MFVFEFDGALSVLNVNSPHEAPLSQFPLQLSARQKVSPE